MLERLCVKNFAIIEDLIVDFNTGMTVLTGQTGAGKSLIIDTISLLLGSRADSDMIRYGENTAHVEGVFSTNDELNQILVKYNIPVLDKITILREISDSGKNVIKINNYSITLALLKNIASYLADIHIQNDTYKLFNPDNYLELLDPKDDEKLNKLMIDYSKKLYSYLECIKEYEHILKGQKEAIERLDFLKYEHEELSNLNLTEGIDVELEEKIAKLSNYDKIFNSLNEAYNALENQYNPLDQIYDAAKALENISEYDSSYLEYSEKLLDAYYISTEIKDDISKQINSLDYDEDELNSYIESLNEINKAKDKYKKSVSELIEYLKKITLDIEMATNYDFVLNESIDKCKKAFEILKQSAIKITEYRGRLATNLTKSIINECRDLDLENTKFEIIFNEVNYDSFLDKSIFKETGVDTISFMITFNKGEPLRPLHKVASGGEMSRIMLAFKSVLSKNTKANLMVFDEIDTGVSGSTAKKIAKKMYDISKNTQVLCITHLPQVAAIGDYHKHIYKIEDDSRTNTQIDDLDYDRRVEEIAVMLSGDKISLYALEHARELLKR